MHRSISLILIILFSLLQYPEITAKDTSNKKFTVVIDPGHGGKDIGATDNGVMEKNINLQVAKQLESLIKKKMKDTKVVMTRDNDSYLTLQERADKANKSQGDLFISIHTNSVDKKNRNRKNISGSSVYTLGLHKDENNLQVAMRENSVIEFEKDYEQKYSGFDPQRDESYIIFEMAQKKNLSQSIRFAESVEKELVGIGRQDRGVHQAGFWVLWATSMPAVLVELDFICNPESAKYMSSDKGVKELANAIFKAVENYESLWKRMTITSNRGESDTFIPGDEDNRLTETYTDLSDNLNSGEVAVVSSRRKKSLRNESQVSNIGNYSDRRKRRSMSGRAHSSEVSYEKEDLQANLKYGLSVSEFGDSELIPSEKETEKNLNVASTDNKKKKNDKKSKKAKDNRKEKKNKKEDGHNAKVNKLVTVYKIQVLASEDLLKQGNARFCGLSPISTYKENNLYKYYYGESTDKAELEALLPSVRKKIPDAFIVSGTKSVSSTKNN